ncbi:MAG TPA: SPFH domain-containing protein [Oligoflexia bacterium]|nr:SPFH domain-containing protein [Oligoflexia bacterium]HMP27844.1 SPFH domain-containing protein [Oligoflexia bacterium]
MLKNLLLFLVIFIGGILILAYTFGEIVRPGQMGIRQITFGPSQGFSNEGLSPGYHWSVPFYSKIHIIPRTVQTINLERADGETHNRDRVRDSVEIQTTDGSGVKADITLLYRFYAERSADHGGPAELIRGLGIDSHRWTQSIETSAINELRKALGRLSTSQFYDPALREAAIIDSQREINKRLSPYGIGVEAVLLRRYTYTEERIDTAIFQKNLQDQEERLNNAASLLAQAKAELEKVAAEWDAKIKTLKVEGDNKARVIRSEGELYRREKIAAGDLLLAEARAEIDRQRAAALAQTKGAESYLGRELAPLLTSLRGGVIGQIDPYDLEGWLKKLGVNKGAE